MALCHFSESLVPSTKLDEVRDLEAVASPEVSPELSVSGFGRLTEMTTRRRY